MPAPRKTPAKTTGTPATKAVTTENISSQLVPTEANGSTESFESAELAALKAELERTKAELETAKNHPTDATGRPLADSQLTPEQLQIRALQDELARTKGASIETIQEVVEEVNGEGFLIHILEDGLTVAGRVRYRGEEILFGPEAYEETKDRFGQSWLHQDDTAQFERWGSVKFRKGPWPGKKTYDENALANANIRSVAPTTQI